MKRKYSLFLYKKFIRPVRRYFYHRSPLFYSLWGFIILCTTLLYYLSKFVVELIYEPEMESLLSPFLLNAMIFLPVVLVFYIFIISLKIFLDHIRRIEGTMIRYKLVKYFLFVTIVPSILYIYIFSRLINASVDVFFQPHIIDSIGNSLNILKDSVSAIQRNSIKTLSDISRNAIRLKGYQISSDSNEIVKYLQGSHVDYLYLYQGNERLGYYSIKNELKKIKKVFRSFSFKDLIKNSDDIYSSYQIHDDYILTILPLTYGQGETPEDVQTERKIVGYLAGVFLVSPSFSKQILDTLDAITSIKQFQILKIPLKNSLLFIYIYFYVPILSLGILFFYYKSNQISKPIGQLSTATKKISKGDFSFKIDHDGNDEIQNLVLSFKAMSKELMYNRIKLQNVSHIEAWKDVAVKLAHELKNPLTPILLAVERIEKTMTKTDFDTYSKLNDSFNLIKSGIGNIGALITDFSKFSRDINIHKEKTNMLDILSGVEKELMHYPDIEHHLDVRHGELMINVDKRKMQQVFTNMIQNAVDSLQQVEEVKKIIKMVSRLENEKDEKNYVFEIENNGPWIPMEIRSKIFEPYFTTKKKGTGLGLTICERIITGHGGKIYLESKTGKTSFTIIIPIHV